MIGRSMRIIKPVVCCLLATLLILSFHAPVVSGLTSADIQSIVAGTEAYNPDFAAQCSVSSTATPGTNTNIDYKGNQIFNDAQVTVITQNQPFYEAAAKQVDIPWQMIAVIHIRESGGQRANPANGQGVYQFVDKHGGPYPAGAVSDTEFARQTALAAAFIKAKAGSNYQANRTLTASSGTEPIKDTFFSYNGRAGAYTTQAKSLGFGDQQGYEGSPYVMNIADARRDPASAPLNTWGQIKTDGGAISYPANKGYGAFVMYAALSGVSLTGNCSNTVSGPTRDRVMALARQELELWQSGKMNPGTNDYHKYTAGASANWCAYFVSWIFNQAGYPIDTSAKDGVVPAVDTIEAIGRQGVDFVWHDAAGYKPQPGDIVIQKNGKSHTNIVVAADGDSFTVIGGNQGYANGGATDFSNSKVTQYTISGTNSDGTTGFVSPRQ